MKVVAMSLRFTTHFESRNSDLYNSSYDNFNEDCSMCPMISEFYKYSPHVSLINLTFQHNNMTYKSTSSGLIFLPTHVNNCHTSSNYIHLTLAISFSKVHHIFHNITQNHQTLTIQSNIHTHE